MAGVWAYSFGVWYYNPFFEESAGNNDSDSDLSRASTPRCLIRGDGGSESEGAHAVLPEVADLHLDQVLNFSDGLALDAKVGL